jgi:hypothetical protein
MNIILTFSDVLFLSLAKVNKAVEKILVHFIHVLKSKIVKEDMKQAIRDEIVDIAAEMNTFYMRIDLSKLSQFDIKEIEKRIIEKNTELEQRINQLIASIAKRTGIAVDKKEAFQINDIIGQLSEARIQHEYGFTRDKIDYLFSVKRFIANMYNEIFKNSVDKEKKAEKNFYLLKEKTFLEEIRNAEKNNPEYYFKTQEVLKKKIFENTKVDIYDGKSERPKNTVLFQLIDSESLNVFYNHDGILLDCSISKKENENNFSYLINGMLGKGVSEIKYHISFTTVDKLYEPKEHILGFDFIWTNYEKAYIEYVNSKDASQNKVEEMNKNIINNAIDDLLFG